MAKVIRLSIPGMKCIGCVTAIEKTLNSESTVNNVEVDLEAKMVVIEADTPLSVLLDMIKSAGYDATEISEE